MINKIKWARRLHVRCISLLGKSVWGRAGSATDHGAWDEVVSRTLMNSPRRNTRVPTNDPRK